MHVFLDRQHYGKPPPKDKDRAPVGRQPRWVELAAGR